MVTSIITNALGGLNNASNQINKSANNIANAGVTNDGASLPQDIIDIKISEIAYKANLAVIETANELTDTLLKTFDEEV
jgi:flagellar basal body rod protein FlgC